MAPSEGSKIRIAVIESDPLRLIGLQTIFRTEPDFALSPETVSSILADPNEPVVLLGGRGMPDVHDTMAQLKEGRPEVRILVTGSGKDDEEILQALAAGAKGYVHEGAPAAEFIRAIRVVNSGSVWASRRVLSIFIERVSTPQPAGKAQALVFTSRELEVLSLLVEGHSNREIGDALGIEVRTVKMHVGRLMRKAAVHNRIALSVFAVTRSILPKTPKA